MHQSGNRQELENTFSQWVHSFSDELFRWAVYKTNDSLASEDLVQDTFLAAMSGYENFQGKSQPKTWLFSILNNKIYDYHRQKFKSKEVYAGATNVSEAFTELGDWNPQYQTDNWFGDDSHLLDNHLFRQILNDCLSRLPKNWFSAIHLKFMDDKSGPEICQELNIAPTNFWQILHRAKLQLKVCIENNWEGQ